MKTNAILAPYINELKKNKSLLILSTMAIIVSYSVYFFCSENRITHLADENDFFELGTALFFFVGSIFFLRIYLKTKNIFFLLLTLLLFVGGGEELSWGQHLFNFATPEAIKKDNVQGEFNFHNIEAFNTDNFDGTKKSSWKRLLEINFLFKLFCSVYGIIFPILAYHWKGFNKFINTIKLPIPEVSIGMFFMLNWLAYQFLLRILPTGKSVEYYQATTEIYEFLAAFIFLLISFKMRKYIYKKKNIELKGESDTESKAESNSQENYQYSNA